MEIFPKAQSDQDSALSLTWWALAFTFILSSIIPSSFPKTTVVLKHTNNNNNTLLFSIILYSLSLLKIQNAKTNFSETETLLL